jgi:hypothetical protein
MEIRNTYRKTRLTLANATLLLLADPSAERWSHTRVAEALNDAQLDFCLETQMAKEELNVRLLENVFEYDIKNRIATDGTVREYGFPLRVGFSGRDETALWPTSLKIMDFSGLTRDDKIQPSRWYLDSTSPGKICVLPPASDGNATTEVDNIQVLYVAMPTYMSANGSYPDTYISSSLHRALPYGAASRLLDESNDKDDLVKADYMEARFRFWIGKAKVEQFRGKTKYNNVRPV